MDAAKTLIRTTARTFFKEPKQILIIDALLLHSVLHIEDFTYLLNSQAKEIRQMMTPLRNAQLVWTHSRSEARVGSNRGTQREYYYINFHRTVDAIKYRTVKLRNKVKEMYKNDETKKRDWYCPRCKAEYDDMAILNLINEEGFYCERCGTTLIENQEAKRERGNHEKITKLNTQLAKFDMLFNALSHNEFPENSFAEAWEKKKEVPKELVAGAQQGPRYIDLKQRDRDAQAQKQQTFVDADALSVTVQSQSERELQEEEAKERRRVELARQNQLPEWHSKTAGSPALKSEEHPLVLKREESEDKKNIVAEEAAQEDFAQYLAEMEQAQRLEEEKRAKEAEEEDDEDDEFEDVVGTSALGTPMSSQPGSKLETPRTNGRKRELDPDGDSLSGTDTNANTPADRFEPKRIKLENGVAAVKVENEGTANGAESDEDDDFEDVQ